MKTLSELKKVKVGDKFKMVYHAWDKGVAGSLIGIVRAVKKVQSNSIQFEPITEGKQGSWLSFPSAKHFKGHDNGFSILFNYNEMGGEFKEGDIFITYEAVV